MVGTIEHASESCGVYSCKYLIRSNTVGITSTLSIGDGDTGRYLSIESVTAYWRGTGRPNPKVDLDAIDGYQIYGPSILSSHC